MTVADIVARHADSRPEMTLVDYVEVGLPVWRVLARCDVLEQKQISTIDETAMSAIALGVDDPLDLQILLGLDAQVLETTLAGLVVNEWAQDADTEGRLALTETGQEIMAVAKEVVAREIVVPFDYDGLLRRPTFDQNLVDRRRGSARGLREVPAAPERPPDVTELRGCRQAIASVLRRAAPRQEKDAQLLAIRSIDRRDRYMLPAVAMVFAPKGRGRCEVALAIGDEPSIEHEAAFVNADLGDRISLDRRLRSTQRRPLARPGPTAHHSGLDEDAEHSTRSALKDARERLMSADADTTDGAADGVRRARAALNELRVRTVLPYEHEALMRVALSSSRHLLIAGGAITAAQVDTRFLSRLRRALEKGTLVRIIVSGAAAGSENVLKTLRNDTGDYPGLVLEEQDLGDEGLLVSDDRFVAYGAFPWLGQLGDRERPLSDTRSLLVRDSEAANQEWERLDGRTADTASRTAKRRKRNRRRGRGQQWRDSRRSS